MADRRGSRLALEVLFLLGLAAALVFADLAPLAIGGVMLAGWVIVAAFEWASWRGEPHYGSGLPPRYSIPRLDLPPPRPLEQVHAGYPEATRDEAPTWIASAALREEMLGEWPLAAQVAEEPPEPAVAAVPERVVEEPVVEPIGDVEPVVEPAVEAVVDPVLDPWLLAELPATAFAAVVQDAGAEAVAAEPVAAEAEPEPEADAELEPAELEPEPVPEPAPAAVNGEAVRTGPVERVARYTPDPLADAPVRHRFRRDPAPHTIEVAARPRGVRALPGQAPRQSRR